MKPVLAVACVAGLLAMTSAARAQDDDFFIKFGPAELIPHESASISLGGAHLPGASISIENHFTASVEIGYQLTPDFSVSFTGGLPPTVDIDGAGTLSGVGRLGTVTYGPTALTAQYTFANLGRLKPYIGAGPMFMFVFDNEDGAMTNLKVDPAIGAVLRAGIDFDLTKDWGLFLDVKQAYLRTHASGVFGGSPVKADVILDPTVVSIGLARRF
ncbi:MAG TPA: OmpW family outer membrane protein [Hyphomicrobiales bacterium]|jgi:outer membrane protein